MYGSPIKTLGDDGFKFLRIAIVSTVTTGEFRLMDNLG